jgi:hypothetical protein
MEESPRPPPHEATAYVDANANANQNGKRRLPPHSFLDHGF